MHHWMAECHIQFSGHCPLTLTYDLVFRIIMSGTYPGFIRVREMSGKFDFFQGQGIVREFYVMSGKN